MNFTNFNSRIKESSNFKSGSAAERIDIWKKALIMISENPIFGSGTGSFYKKEIQYMNEINRYIKKEKLGEDQAKQLKEKYKIVGHTHNEYLQFYVENGIFGFLILVGIILKIFYDFHRRKKSKNIISFLPILVIAVISFFSFLLHMIHNLTLVAIYMGVLEIDES